MGGFEGEAGFGVFDAGDLEWLGLDSGLECVLTDERLDSRLRRLWRMYSGPVLHGLEELLPALRTPHWFSLQEFHP